jgi:hypothetical protein
LLSRALVKKTGRKRDFVELSLNSAKTRAKRDFSPLFRKAQKREKRPVFLKK